MANAMGSTFAVGSAQQAERSRLEAKSRYENGVVRGEDDARAAQLGAVHELPSLGEVFEAWLAQVRADECEDYAVDFRDLLLAPDGRLDMGARNIRLAGLHGTSMSSAELLPMTYRTFGGLIRDYTRPPRNSAANLIDLPRAQDPHAHTGRTMRGELKRQTAAAGFEGTVTVTSPDSPRSIAYNARLDVKKRADQSVTSLTGEPATTVLVRTRKLARYDENGVKVAAPRTVIGQVTPTHCLRDGDDDKLIAALVLAFAGSVNTARASAYRGVEESELRAVLPALSVKIPGAGDQEWTGYITARNSESGAKSWSISAGLYRQQDGASVACEAVIRTGRHVGSKVAQRMVEIAEGAAELLRTLVDTAGELAGKTWDASEKKLCEQLRAALAGTVLHDADTCCGIAWALGAEVERNPVSIGSLMNVLGKAAGACVRRVDARPVEVMLGRMLISGWSEFKNAGTETVDDGSGEE